MRNAYHATELVTLYLGDCCDVMREMPENSVDAIVTDPPYGLTENTGAGRRYCLAGVLQDIVLPDLQHLQPKLFGDRRTHQPSALVSLLRIAQNTAVEPGVCVPEGSVDLQDCREVSK